MDETHEQFDVVVVGGGAAGLSGALTLARARRSVLVDRRRASSATCPAAGVHGLPHPRRAAAGRAGCALGRAEVEGYGGVVVDGARDRVGRQRGSVFAVALDDGRASCGRRLLVTTGLVDELPDVPGLRERWGTDVVHCPYCHGYEVRDEPSACSVRAPALTAPGAAVPPVVRPT